MSATIVQLNDINDPEGEFHEFLDELKKDQKRGIFLLTGKDGLVRLGCTAKHPAELIVMLHEIEKIARHMVENYSAEMFVEDDDEEDDE